MSLSKEQIAELLNEADSIKPNSYGTYTPTKYEAPSQLGPVRFLNDGPTNKCVHSRDGHIICGSPAYIKFQGKYHCLLHVAVACNDLLVTMGVLE